MKPDAAQIGNGQGKADRVVPKSIAEIKRSAVPNALPVERQIDFRRGRRVDNPAQIQPQKAFIEVVIQEVDFAGNSSNSSAIEPHRKTSRFSDVEKRASQVMHEGEALGKKHVQ